MHFGFSFSPHSNHHSSRQAFSNSHSSKSRLSPAEAYDRRGWDRIQQLSGPPSLSLLNLDDVVQEGTHRYSLDNNNQPAYAGAILDLILFLPSSTQAMAIIHNTSSRTFAVAELLEQILLELPDDRDIVRAQLVSATWLTIIRGSGRLQKRMYLIPEPPAPERSPRENNNISISTPFGTMSIPHPSESMALKSTAAPRIRVNSMLTSIPALPCGLWRISTHLHDPSPSDSRAPMCYKYWLPIQDPLLYDIYRSRMPDLVFQQSFPSLSACEPGDVKMQSWRRMFLTQPPARRVRISLVHESVILSFRSKKLVHSAKRYRSRILESCPCTKKEGLVSAGDRTSVVEVQEAPISEHGVRLGELMDAAEGFLKEEFESAKVEGPRMWPLKEHVWIVEALVEGSASTGLRNWSKAEGRGVFWKDSGNV